jgi:glycosyltransferase involved in cell wall biosynthesis
MTPGVSLDVWRKNGTFQRETALMRYLADDDWHIRVLTFCPEKAEDYFLPRAISTIYYPHGRLLDFLAYSHFKLRFWADLIQTNQSYGSWQYAQAAAKWGKPFLLRCGWVYGEGLETTQGITDETKRIQALERKAFRQATLVEVTAEHLKDWVVERYGVEPFQIHVIPNHVDTDLFRPLSVQKFERSVVSVGNLLPVKRFDLLLRACARANVDRITIFGDGPERPKLMQLAHDFKINLQLPGVVRNEDLPELLQQHQIFLSTSRREGHPKSLIEAMSCEMPCLGVNVVGVRNCILQSQGGGFIVEPDVEAIAEALNVLFEHPEQMQKLGARAREYILTSMDASVVLARRKNVMMQCIEKYANSGGASE